MKQLVPWRRLGGLPRPVWPRCAGFFGQRQPAGPAGRGGQGHTAALPRPTATPTPCAGPCGQSWRAEGVPAEQILCGNGAADLIFRLALAAKPRPALVTAPLLPSMPPPWKRPAARWNGFFCGKQEDFAVTEAFVHAVHPGGYGVPLPAQQPHRPADGPAAGGSDAPPLRGVRRRAGGGRMLPRFPARRMPCTRQKVCWKNGEPGHLKSLHQALRHGGRAAGLCLCADTALLEQMQAAGQPWAVSSLAQAAGLAALEETAYVEGARPDCRTAAPPGGRPAGAGPAGAGRQGQLSAVPRAGRRWAKRCGKGAVLRSCGNYPGLDASWYRTAVRTENENGQLLDWPKPCRRCAMSKANASWCRAP